MNVEQRDYVVVGNSLAGIAAALALAEGGGRVVLLDFHRDTDAIEDLPRIEATSLGQAMSGDAFHAAVQQSLKRAGVEQQRTCFVESVSAGERAVVDCGDRHWNSRGVVFAPNGTEPGIDLDGSTALQGFGLSYSAAADAPFFSSRPVAVYGDSPRVLEHARIAAQYASEVVVLMKGSPVLAGDLGESHAFTFEHDVSLHSLRSGADGLLTGIEFDAARGRRSVDAAALFIAQHLTPATDVVQGTTGDAIAFAGLASGINYWSHAELVADGVRAARALLSRPSTSPGGNT